MNLNFVNVKIIAMANQTAFGETTFGVGDIIRVHNRLLEQEKKSGRTKKDQKIEQRERIQIFEGMVLAINGQGENKSFLVRKIGAGGIGVERIYPVGSPWIVKVELKKKGDVRRSKLYYVRDRKSNKDR